MKASRTRVALASSAAVALLVVLASASAQQRTSTTGQLRVVLSPTTPRPCMDSLKDSSGTGPCIEASSVPELGRLFPMSEHLNVDQNSGFVGIGTDHAFRPLEVVGDIGSSSGSGIF